jgi:hypothetical protein
MAATLDAGKLEGTIVRRRQNGKSFTVRVVLTPRRNPDGTAIGFLLVIEAHR